MLRSLLPLALAAVLIGCGDADAPVTDETMPVTVTPAADASAAEIAEADAPPTDAPTVETAAPVDAAEAVPASRSGAPTTAQCRTEVGPRVTPEPLRVVADQTFAAASPKHGAGCFVTAYDPVSMADGSVYPYVYTYTDATGAAETSLAFYADSGEDLVPDASLRLIAVGFNDTNADGKTDVVMVHDDCATALSWLAQDDEWFHAVPNGQVAGLPACTVAEATQAFRDYWASPVSP